MAKASRRLYFLRLLKRAGVDQQSILTVYTMYNVHSICSRVRLSSLEFQRPSISVGRSRAGTEKGTTINLPSPLLEPGLGTNPAANTRAKTQQSVSMPFKEHHTTRTQTPPHFTPKRNNNLRNSNTFGLFRCCTGRFKNSFSRSVSPFLILFSSFVF